MDEANGLINKEPVDFLTPEDGVDQSAVNFSAAAQQKEFLGGGQKTNVNNVNGEKRDGRQFKTLLGVVKSEDEAVRIHEKLKKIGEGEFGESKARDENGELSIVWHGSPRIFDQFDQNAAGEYRWRNEGIHFQSSKDMVKQYAEKAKDALGHTYREIIQQDFGKEYDIKNNEHVQTVIGHYNEMVRDLIEHGMESKHIMTRNNIVQLTYGNTRMDLDSFKEIFGGKLPDNDNTVMVKGPNGTELYYGKDIGKVYYAAVLNIKNPHIEETTDLDNGYEVGEETHKKGETDGTILNHTTNIKGMGGLEVEGTAGTSSYGVFDTNEIKIIGREVNGIFELMPEFANR